MVFQFRYSPSEWYFNMCHIILCIRRLFVALLPQIAGFIARVIFMFFFIKKYNALACAPRNSGRFMLSFVSNDVMAAMRWRFIRSLTHKSPVYPLVRYFGIQLNAKAAFNGGECETIDKVSRFRPRRRVKEVVCGLVIRLLCYCNEGSKRQDRIISTFR